jgi:hypothetical protein
VTDDLTVRAARDLLTEYRKWHVQRDHLFRVAHRSGITISEISRLTGHGRSTIERVITDRAARLPARLRAELAAAVAGVETDPAALTKIQKRTDKREVNRP